MTTTSTNDPLARLVVDDADVDRELLASALEDRVRLDLQRGAFSFLPGVRDRLSARALVATALLAQYALHLLDDRYVAGLAPRDLEERTGVHGGTLRPILKRLADRRLIRKDGEVYAVPGYALEQVAREFEGKE